MNATPPALNTLRQALRGGCLTLDQLTALQDARLPQEEAKAAWTHITTCAECEAEWRMLQEFESATPEAEERADVEAILARAGRNVDGARRESWWKRLNVFSMPRLAGAFACAALMVVVGIQWKSANRMEDPGREWRAGASLRVLTEGDLNALPGEFRWTAVAGASLYEISLSEVDGNPLWKGNSTFASVKAPADVRRWLLPRKTVVLKVRALDAAGRVVADSEPARLRLMPQKE